MKWRQAFLKQAISDYSVFKELNKSQFPLCHKLHYLQMATEKLAKAYLCSPNGGPPPKIHNAFVRFLKVSKGRPEIRRKLGYDNNYNAYNSYIDNSLETAEKIEKLAPVGGSHERLNPEYPWLDTSNSIICPACYSFPEFSKLELVKIQTLISSLIRTIAF